MTQNDLDRSHAVSLRRPLAMPKQIAALLLTVAPFATSSSCTDPQAARAATARHVGSAACVSCHETQHDLWRGSHHDLAMQPATSKTVLGDFSDATFSHFGVTSTFFQKEGAYYVRTDGPDGELTDYRVKYCFGVEPLQQYLIEFPGGRLQSLGLCWDSRPAEVGGQRWFHLYPDEKIGHDDPLHWTAHVQTWNHQCATCHSTNLRRGYDLATDTYDTTWSEMNVACEACHGPGSNHLDWASAAAAGDGHASADKGLAVQLPKPGTWTFEPGAVIASRQPPLPSQTQTETCAPCHARRTPVHEEPALGQSFLENYRPATLEEGLYHADGQILDEVYVWGSFVQSKMHHAGVTCSDCHEPHSLQLRAPDNALCVRCHLSSEFDSPTHHFHEADGPGSLCVDCHMTSRTYMVVDPRRDHSFRVPRPDLTVRLGTPNACANCHQEQSAQWAANAVAEWYPDKPRPPHFADALHAARTNRVDATPRLMRLAADGAQPAIARATALELLGPDAAPILPSAVRDPSALVRRAALTATEQADPRLALALATPLLSDPVRSVRLEACRAVERVCDLEPAVREAMSAEVRNALQEASRELDAMRELNADQPWSHVNRGLALVARGETDQAEAAYRKALEIDPTSVEASLTLAELYRERGRDDLAQSVLRSSLARNPGSPDLSHMLGLALVRGQRYTEAIHWLEQAHKGHPDNARYGYVFAVALHETGNPSRCLEVLEQLHRQHPGHRQILEGLVAYHRQAGNQAETQRFTEKLERLNPR